MQEIETKILEVDKEEIKKTFKSLGAKEIKNIQLFVDWFGLVCISSYIVIQIQKNLSV